MSLTRSSAISCAGQRSATRVSLNASAPVVRRAACSRSQVQTHRPFSHGIARAPEPRGLSTVTRASQLPETATSDEFKYVPAYTDAKDARNAVLRFYHAYNRRDLTAMMAEIADDVFYEDLVYDDPFVGKKVLGEYLAKTLNVPEDLRFVMEDMTEGGGPTCGVSWHVELTNGTKIPFSRGASFYRVNDEGKIVKGRDLVEALPKAGDAAFGVMTFMTPLLRELGGRGMLNSQAIALPALGMWSFYALYMGVIMFGSSVPGNPVYKTSMDSIMEVLHESENFFYVNIWFHQIGITLVPSVAEHPISEALFNFVNAWSMMLLPLIMIDRKAENMESKYPLWFGIQFLTNIFCIPYLALREQQIPRSPELPTKALPSWTPLMGAVAFAVGLGSMAWAVAARPELAGDVSDRLSYLHDKFYGDRVFFAFVVDSCLYSVWQVWMMEAAPAKYKYVPFFGLAAWLITREGASNGDEAATADQASTT